MSITYSRPAKLNHADTILYEIDMLRFATSRLVEQDRSPPRESRDAWIYLEAFLIHFRNLIEFLGKQRPRPTDLHVTTIWGMMNLAASAGLDKIHEEGAKLLSEYEPTDQQGGGRISQYLQHCTTKRVDAKDWRIDTMSEQIEALLVQIEPLLRPTQQMLSPVKPTLFLGPVSASTT